jgi:hypothetical protein
MQLRMQNPNAIELSAPPSGVQPVQDEIARGRRTMGRAEGCARYRCR